MVLRLMEIKNQERLILSAKYMSHMLFNPLRRVNNNANLCSPFESKINRAIGPAKPTVADWVKIKEYNRHQGKPINKVMISTLDRSCHVLVMKNGNETLLVHLVPIMLHQVERVPHEKVGACDIPEDVRYRSTENRNRPKGEISRWAIFEMKIADESAIKSSQLLVDRQNYGFENFREKLVRTEHTLKGMIQYKTRITIHEIVQRIVSEPSQTTVCRVIKNDKDLVLQHQWGHMYKVSKVPERNPDIFRKNTQSEPKEVLKNKARPPPQCLTLISGN